MTERFLFNLQLKILQTNKPSPPISVTLPKCESRDLSRRNYSLLFKGYSFIGFCENNSALLYGEYIYINICESSWRKLDLNDGLPLLEEARCPAVREKNVSLCNHKLI